MNEKLSSDLDAKMQLHSAYVEELKILQVSGDHSYRKKITVSKKIFVVSWHPLE